MKNKNLLYVYEERIPKILQNLIISEIKKNKFNFKKMTYKTPVKIQKKLFAWSDAVFFAPGRFISSEVFEEAKKAKIFQLWSSGYDKFNLSAAKKNGIMVCNNGSQNNISVAEHSVMLMLALSRKLIHFNKITVKGKWTGNSHGVDLNELKNKILGIVGFGKIGQRVAKICLGFDMNIIYHDKKRLSKKKENLLQVKYASKKEIFKKSDIISLHLHLNKDTKYLINRKNIKLFKNNVIIINTSRANLIEKKAIEVGLRKKKIGGVGIDVHYIEPTIKNDKILKHPSVIATPHTAGSTMDTHKRVIFRCFENIKNRLNNNKVKWKI